MPNCRVSRPWPSIKLQRSGVSAASSPEDMAIVFYRSSKGETPTSLGRWTQVEIAHLKKQGVPDISLDIDRPDLKADMDAALTSKVLSHPLIKTALGRL